MRVGVRAAAPAGSPQTVVTAVAARWVLRIAAAGLPLVFMPNGVDEFVLPKLLALRVVVLVLAVLWLLRLVESKRLEWRRTPLGLPLLAFLLSAVVAPAFAVIQNVALFGTYARYEGLLTFLTYAAAFWLTVQLLGDASEARMLVRSFLVGGYVLAVVAVLQSTYGFFTTASPTEHGFIRADGMQANPDNLGTLLALLLPLAVRELLNARSLATRVLAGNAVLMIAAALLLTFTRGAWVGAAVGVAFVLVYRSGINRQAVMATLVVALILAALVLADAPAAVGAHVGRSPIGQALFSRLLTFGDPTSGSGGIRLQVWRDSLPLIASRPVLGYGPDTFGLVFPHFSSVNEHFTLWDKAHEETLQTAATQGLVGAAAYLWTVAAFVVAFWRGRRNRGAATVFGGWLGYFISNQINFSFLTSAAPFWIFAGAAMVIWTAPSAPVLIAPLPRRLTVALAVAGTAGLALLIVPWTVTAYLAEADNFSAQDAASLGSLDEARAGIAQARSLNPHEAEYAKTAGDFALVLDANGNPRSSADYAAAREAYRTADRLGSFSPEMYRHLAITEEHLGDHQAAVAAARHALDLDRYDPASRALVVQLGG